MTKERRCGCPRTHPLTPCVVRHLVFWSYVKEGRTHPPCVHCAVFPGDLGVTSGALCFLSALLCQRQLPGCRFISLAVVKTKGETAQLVKCLLCRQEDLEPMFYFKKKIRAYWSTPLSTREAETDGSLSLAGQPVQQNQ